MNQYVFILGRNPELSAAEIKAILPQAQVVRQTSSFLILEMDEEIMMSRIASELTLKCHSEFVSESLNEAPDCVRADKGGCQVLLNRLGGTIKIGKMLSNKVDRDKIVETLKQMGSRIESGMTGKKINFGLSYYESKPNHLGMEVKTQLKSLGISSRLVVSKDKALSSVVVTKNKCTEFLVLQNQWLAKTCAVQEFEDYSNRDYGRPVRDLVSGSLPPKLAQVMINLSQTPTNAIVLDPFCGSGTILQEAILMGYKSIIGSDKSDKAIEDTKRNLEWLAENSKLKIQSSKFKAQHGIRVSSFVIPAKAGIQTPDQVRPVCRTGRGNKDGVKIFQSEVDEISSKVKTVDAIVTEPYLGPALRGGESREQIKKIISELEDLYLKTFSQFAKILSSNGKIVIIFPWFKEFNLTLDIFNQIKKLGFNQLDQNNLVYSRPDQRVFRRIHIFSR